MNLDDQNLLYSKEDKKRVTSLFAVQILNLQIDAQYPRKLPYWLPKPLKFLGQLLIYIHNVFLIFLLLHLSVLHMKLTYDKLHDGSLEDITDALVMAIVYALACFSTSYFMWLGKPMESFLERINRNYRHHSLAGLTFVSSYVSYDRARKVMIIWAVACQVGVLLWGLAPIIMRSRTLPLKCWYPFDEMLLGQIFVGFAFGNASALFVSLVIIMLGQFDVLFCSLKNFEFNARLMAGEDLRNLRKVQMEIPVGQDDELNQYIFGTEFKTDLTVFEKLRKRNLPKKSYKQYINEALVDCFEHHRFIIDCCRELEQFFNPFCLIKSLQITMQLCLLTFVGVMGERTLLRIINFVQYGLLTFNELLMFTYFGELLHNQSLRGGDALWRAAWWRSSIHVRQDILIFLLNSRRAVKLTAGKFFVMDVERFRSVVMQAFSFLTLLQKLEAKNVK